jgi:hypothetical protein
MTLYEQTEQVSASGNASRFSSEGVFESREEQRKSWLRFFVVLLYPSRKIAGYFFK